MCSPRSWVRRWSPAVLGALAAAIGCDPAQAVHPARAAAEADARWMLEYYVAALQERHRAVHGRFAADYSALFNLGAPRQTSRALGAARPGFEVRIAGAGAAGWSAAITPRAFPGAVCVLTVGDPPTAAAVPGRGGVRMGPPGEVACAGFTDRRARDD